VNKDDEMSFCSTSGVYSSSVSAVSNSFLSQMLSSVDPLQTLCVRSSAEQCLHSLPASNECDCEYTCAHSCHVRELEQVSAKSDDSHVPYCELSLLALDASNELLSHNKTLLKQQREEVFDAGKEWQSVTVNSLVHKSDESAVDRSSVISDSGVDSSTVSSRLCASELSTRTAAVNSSALHEISLEARRPLHLRSASEGGIFKPSQCLPNLSHHGYVHETYTPGTV